MAAALDEAIGNVTAAFKKAGLWDNTLLVFTTDNGGNPHAGGNNWPLRGGKFTLWEGGVRGVSFIHGNMLPNKGTVSNKLAHAVDWLPTLVNLVGGSTKSPHPLDGIDIWSALTSNSPSPRTEILFNVDPIELMAAVRVGDWKLVVGHQEYSDWIPPPQITSYVKQPQYTLPNIVALFNISSDPTERHDLALEHPEIVTHLLSVIDGYEKNSVFPDYKLPDIRSMPSNFGGAWTPWRG